MNSPQRPKLPNRQRFLELALVAVALFVAIYTLAAYTVPVPETRRHGFSRRTLEDLRIIDAAQDQYSLETSRPAPAPVSATPAPKDGSR